MMPTTSRRGDQKMQMQVNGNGNGNMSNSSTSSDSSDAVPPSLAIVQKKFDILCEEVRKKNLWTMEIAVEIDTCLSEFLHQFQQRKQKRTYTDALVCGIFENLQYILNRFLVPPGYMLGNLSSTLTATINLTTELAQDENICANLRDNYGMVQVLIDVFNPTMKSDDMNLVLTCTKILTKDLVISWKAPYLYKLIDQFYTFIETRFDDKANIFLVLQILINLYRKNVSCVLVGHENTKCKSVWKKLEGVFDNRDIMYANALEGVLISHYIFVMTSSIQSGDFSGCYQVAEVTLQHVLNEYKHTRAYQERSTILLEALSDQITSISEKFQSVYDKCESSLITNATSDQSKSLLDGKTDYLEFVEKITSGLATFFQTRREVFEESFEISILHLLISTMPSYISIRSMPKAYLNGLEITEKIFRRNGALDITKMCLKFYVRVAEQLEKMDGLESQKSHHPKEVEAFLLKALNNLELDSGSDVSASANLELTALILRLFSTLGKQAAFSEKILHRLKTDAIKYTIRCLTNSVGGREDGLPLRSICILEILFLMSQHTREVTIFDLMMQLMSLPDISLHIAKCVQMGEEDTVSKALAVLGSVGFANNLLSSISKNIVALRKQGNYPTEIQPTEKDVVFGSHAGVKRIHDVIRAVSAMDEFEDSNKKTKKEIQSLGKILSCYQLNQDMLEHQLASMNSQVMEAKHVNKSLNTLVTKQKQVMNNLLLEKESTAEQLIRLQSKLDKADSESKTLNSASQKEILKLRAELASEKKTMHSLNKAVQEKEIALKQMEADLEAVIGERDDILKSELELKEDKKALTKSLTKMKADLSAAKTKCTELEEEVTAKKKEVVSTRAQLEQQIKTVNTIRGLLGNNNAFGGLLGNP